MGFYHSSPLSVDVSTAVKWENEIRKWRTIGGRDRYFAIWSGRPSRGFCEGGRGAAVANLDRLRNEQDRWSGGRETGYGK